MADGVRNVLNLKKELNISQRRQLLTGISQHITKSVKGNDLKPCIKTYVELWALNNPTG